MSPAGLGPENGCASEGQQQLWASDPSSRQRWCYIRTMKTNVQLNKTLLIVSLTELAAKTNWLEVNASRKVTLSWQFSWALQERLRSGGTLVHLIIERVHLWDVHWTGRTWSREADEFPLLEADARERQLKTLDSGHDLVFAAGICKVWRLAVAL
jgi:hypothetical protein